VTDSFLALADELSRTSQVAPHFLLCGDLNAKVGGLIEVNHAHKFLRMAHPVLQLARCCECQAINAAGRLLADLASSLHGILSTGRGGGDDGQASYSRLPGQELAGLTMSSCLVPFSRWLISHGS